MTGSSKHIDIVSSKNSIEYIVRNSVGRTAWSVQLGKKTEKDGKKAAFFFLSNYSTKVYNNNRNFLLYDKKD